MAKEKGQAKAARSSFSLRLQPYQGSLLAEVVQYLNALERSDAMRQVENVLVMALLAQARLYDEGRSAEERRRCCIEACDALDKHASMLRQLVGVERPVPLGVVPYETGAIAQPHMTAHPVVAQVESDDFDEADEDDEDDENHGGWPPKSRISGHASADEVNSLFGG